LLQNEGYDHVCALTSEAAASLPAETDDGDADESASPPAKRAKTDSRLASLKFLATAAVTPVPAADSNFDRFLVASAPSGVDTLGWWRKKNEFHILSYGLDSFPSCNQQC